jgi:hypothetical protein
MGCTICADRFQNVSRARKLRGALPRRKAEGQTRRSLFREKCGPARSIRLDQQRHNDKRQSKRKGRDINEKDIVDGRCAESG